MQQGQRLSGQPQLPDAYNEPIVHQRKLGLGLVS